MPPLVDPVHLFNARGVSILTEDHLHRENRRLRDRIVELERQLGSVLRRLRAVSGDDLSPPR